MTIVNVTPHQAARWLRHSHQRQIDLMKVRTLLEALEEGRWNPDPDDPVPVRDGVALNGHHRLLAVLMWAAPVPLPVETMERDKDR